MKALVLAAGDGKRLGGVKKCDLEVGGQPLIEHNLRRACEVADEIVVVVRTPEEATYGESYGGVRVVYRIQEGQNGIIGAIECASGALGRHDFFLMLGDEVLIGSRHKQMVSRWKERGHELWGMCGIKVEHDKEKIKKTYSVMALREDPKVLFAAIEKPEVVVGPLMGTGHCIFKNGALDYLVKLPITDRGEKDLVDLMQILADEDKKIEIFEICDQYVNVNTQEDLEEARKIC